MMNDDIAREHIPSGRPQAIVVCGSAVLDTVRLALHRWKQWDFSLPLVITGGIGHSTHYLYQVVLRDFPCVDESPLTSSNTTNVFEVANGITVLSWPFLLQALRHWVETVGQTAHHDPQLTEARIMSSFLYECLNTEEEFQSLDDATKLLLCRRIVLEETSTNCGENAQFTLELLLQEAEPLITVGAPPKRIEIPCKDLSRCSSWWILLQDPCMMRRSVHTFQKWRDHFFLSALGDTSTKRSNDIISKDTVFFPLTTSHKDFVIHLPYDVDRYLSLLIGEVWRLRDDDKGYGPKGRAFITHCDVPQSVQETAAMLEANCLVAPSRK